jgi:hypothetical protein
MNTFVKKSKVVSNIFKIFNRNILLHVPFENGFLQNFLRLKVTHILSLLHQVNDCSLTPSE